MIIQADTRQKKKHHTVKEKYFADNGIKVVNSKMLVGDYCIPGEKIAVDTKANITELYGNLIQDHQRFKNECILAQECGMQLIILIENKDGVKEIRDIAKWKNPQMLKYWKAVKIAKKNNQKPPKPPASNVQLIKMMSTMQKKYGVKFMFCTPDEAGAKVVELLGGNMQEVQTKE